MIRRPTLPFRPFPSLGILLVGILAALPAAASLIRPIPPEDLESRAVLIVEAEVTSVRSGRDDTTGRIARYVELAVERVWRGPRTLDRVVLREAGGSWGDWIHHVTAVPDYLSGSRVLVFLEAGPDGSLRTVGMHQGVFRIESATLDRRTRRGRSFVRDLSARGTFPEARIPARPERWSERELHPVLRRARRSALDVSWEEVPHEIERLQWDPGPGSGRKALDPQGHGASGDLAPGDSRPNENPRFAPLNPGAPARWENAASGTTLLFHLDPAGAPIAPVDQSILQVQRAMDAWSDVPESRLHVSMGNDAYAYVSAGYGSPASVYTGINIVLFDDPYDDISDPVGCSGVLGIGGYWSYSGPLSPANGVDFRPIAQGYVVMADGFGCLLANADNVAELALHELGHALGFGHSSVTDAAMRSSFYGNRGPRLGDDDADGVHCHYPHTFGWVSPAPGASYETGDSVNLGWTRTPETGAVGTVDLEAREHEAAPWLSIATETSDDGAHAWTLPAFDSDQVRVRVRRPNRLTTAPPYPAACSEEVSEAFSVHPAPQPNAGTVPAGGGAPPVRLAHAGGSLTVTWSASCTGEATGYAVYAGALSDLRTGTFSPEPVTCMAGTDGTESFAAPGDDRFYLVVPLAGNSEGGMGLDGAGAPRSTPAVACAPREAGPATCP